MTDEIIGRSDTISILCYSYDANFVHVQTKLLIKPYYDWSAHTTMQRHVAFNYNSTHYNMKALFKQKSECINSVIPRWIMFATQYQNLLLCCIYIIVI